MFIKQRSFWLLPLLMVLFVLLSSCNRTNRSGLHHAEAIMEAHPDSALNLLERDSARICRNGRNARMIFRLLKTEAEDKCFITHNSDSAMLAVTNYFDRYGTSRQKARSHYLLGQVNLNMNQYATALNCFDDVLSMNETTDSVVNRYKARSASWAAGVYENLKIYDTNLHYCKLQYYYALKSDAPSMIVYALRDLGRAYGYLNKVKPAVNYYLRAAKKAKDLCSNELYNMVMDELAGYYLENRMPYEAHKVMADKPYGSVRQNLSMHSFVMANYYDQIGNTDSAMHYYEKDLMYGTLAAKKTTYLNMARCYARNNDMKLVDCYEKFALSSKELEKGQTVVYTDFIENIEKNFDIEEEKASLFKGLILMMVVVVVVSILSIILFSRYKKRQREIRKQRKRIDIFLKQRDEGITRIRENEAQIQKLKDVLSVSNATITNLKRQLVQVEIEKLQKQNEQIEIEKQHKSLLESEFLNSSIYRKFHSKGFVPSNQDINDLARELNRVYNGFTLAIRDTCPKITFFELQVCCLIKIGLSLKDISNMTSYQPSSLAMLRKRLYKRAFNKNGSASDWDDYIISIK